MKIKIRITYALFTILAIMLIALNLFGKKNNELAEDDFTYEISYNLRTDGSVDFQIRTSTYNGQYAPRHCFAMWVTDENDNFVRTLEKRAYSYQQYLTYWYQMTGGNVNNALITSASLNNHITHNINWDCTDSNLQPIPDGIYKIYIEFTESNASGVWHVVEFEKGEQPFELITNGPNNFHDIELYYTPATSPDPVIEITTPEDNSIVENLPFQVEFSLENFDPTAGDGYIGTYINDQLYQLHTTFEPIEITDFPQGTNTLKLMLLDPALAALDPEISDEISLTYELAPAIEITAPSNNAVILNLPFDVEFNLTNFDPTAGDGMVGLFINNQFIQMYSSFDPIEVSNFPEGLNELKLKLLDPSGIALNPEISDMINLTWNPIGTNDELVKSSGKLIGNYPNPFNPSTEISFQLSNSITDARIEIYNLKGQKVKTFPINLNGVEGLREKLYSVTWNGTDDAGNPVSSGIYYYSLKNGLITDTKKMILLK